MGRPNRLPFAGARVLAAAGAQGAGRERAAAGVHAQRAAHAADPARCWAWTAMRTAILARVGTPPPRG